MLRCTRLDHSFGRPCRSKHPRRVIFQALATVSTTVVDSPTLGQALREDCFEATIDSELNTRCANDTGTEVLFSEIPSDAAILPTKVLPTTKRDKQMNNIFSDKARTVYSVICKLHPFAVHLLPSRMKKVSVSCLPRGLYLSYVDRSILIGWTCFRTYTALRITVWEQH